MPGDIPGMSLMLNGMEYKYLNALNSILRVIVKDSNMRFTSLSVCVHMMMRATRHDPPTDSRTSKQNHSIIVFTFHRQAGNLMKQRSSISEKNLLEYSIKKKIGRKIFSKTYESAYNVTLHFIYIFLIRTPKKCVLQ